MKKLLLIGGLLLTSGLCFSQTIDSVSVTIGNPTSTVYIKGIRPQMELTHVTLAALNDMNNTQVINIYFKGCPLNQMVMPYDTVVHLNVPFPFALEIHTLHDTSATCPYPATPFVVDTLHLFASQILGMGELLGEEGIDIHPNPANSLIDICSKLVVEVVSIYSMEGKKLSDQVIEKNKFSMNLANLSQGDYFLVFKTQSSGLITKRVTKKN